MRAARAARIALAGGGSGGHLFPGLALSRTLLGGEGRPVLYGSGKAAEVTWVGDAAERVRLDAPQLPARGSDVPRFLLRLARAVGVSLRDLRARRPDLVVGLGGYASVGPGIAALLSGRPLLLLEQNAVPGRANRLLARLGGRMAAAYPESLATLPPRARSRARVVGNPVRPELRAARRDPARFGLPAGAPVLLVTGGSQGADALNRAVLGATDLFARRGIAVIHLTGNTGAEAARVAWDRGGVRAFVAPFTAKMGDAYALADLVLCRAGGTTVAELAVLGKPSVLVPFPHHADRHQDRNARVLADAGAAVVVPEAELTRERLEREVADRLLDRDGLAAMAAAAREMAVPDAAERAADFASEIMGGSRG